LEDWMKKTEKATGPLPATESLLRYLAQNFGEIVERDKREESEHREKLAAFFRQP
jgi:hypothetical protein